MIKWIMHGRGQVHRTKNWRVLKISNERIKRGREGGRLKIFPAENV